MTRCGVLWQIFAEGGVGSSKCERTVERESVGDNEQWDVLLYNCEDLSDCKQIAIWEWE
jgi:hypothetical protein